MTEQTEVLYLAAGCFWGIEEIYWQVRGVTSTLVGYMGGTTDRATYEQVCTGVTGHAETVRVEYDPSVVSTHEILRIFWEHHDPTQGDRQGNDIGTQYRSVVFTTNDAQRLEAQQTRAAFSAVISEAGFGPITTTIEDASSHPFHRAEEHHQKYLMKHPHGYRCHATTGLRLPA